MGMHFKDTGAVRVCTSGGRLPVALGPCTNGADHRATENIGTCLEAVIKPPPPMRQKSSSGRLGADFGRTCAADGPNLRPEQFGPGFRTVRDTFMAKSGPKPTRQGCLGHLRGGGFFGRWVPASWQQLKTEWR
jgi:hypothetical protein